MTAVELHVDGFELQAKPLGGYLDIQRGGAQGRLTSADLGSEFIQLLHGIRDGEIVGVHLRRVRDALLTIPLTERTGGIPFQQLMDVVDRLFLEWRGTHERSLRENLGARDPQGLQRELDAIARIPKIHQQARKLLGNLIIPPKILAALAQVPQPNWYC